MKPLSAKRFLIDEAYQALLDAVAEGQLKPGERLAQETLAEKLQVSRQPISHALALLKRDGFAVDKGRRGLVVAPLDAGLLRALYQVRAALDGVAARLAADRLRQLPRQPETVSVIEELRRVVDEGRRAVAFTDRVALAQADMRFHQGINRLSGNATILEIAQRQWVEVRRALSAAQPPRDRFLSAWQEHASILDAISVGEGERAERLARQHVEKAGQEVCERLATSGA